MDTERVKEAKEWLESQPMPDVDRQMQRALGALDVEKSRPPWFSRYGKPGGLALGFAVTAGLIAFISLQPRGPVAKPVTVTKSAGSTMQSPTSQRLALPRVAYSATPVASRGTSRVSIAPGITANHTQRVPGLPKKIVSLRAGGGKPSENPPPAQRESVPSAVVGRRAAKSIDDLDEINADASLVQARWTQRSLDEEQKRVASVDAASDNAFIQVPVPQVAANGSPAVALEAWERQKQIVDARLQKRVSIGEKGISFSDLCEKLTKETGVTFKCSRSVADDKLTLFCKARTLRDLMRQVNRIFGYVWDRLGDEPDFEYRLSQPVKNQLVEEELRNKDKNQNVVVWLSDSVMNFRPERLTEVQVVQGQPLNFRVQLDGKSEADVVLGTTIDIVGGEGPPQTVERVMAPLVVLNTTGKPTLTSPNAGFTFRMSGFADGFGNPENAKNNAALKEFDLFQKRVTITPEPVLPKEKLCTSADALEAIFKATGKDVMGDYFTLLIPQARLTQKGLPLFDALNNIGSATYHRWDWEKATVSGESDWLQFRTAGYYNARTREVPNRLLVRWQRARNSKNALDAVDLGEIALLTDPMLDSGNMAQGARLLWGLTEWGTVTGNLRPHWRAFGRLTPERQEQALGVEGIGFRQLKLENQQELFGLISPQKRPSEFQLAGDLSAEDFWRATLQVRYPAPKEGAIFTYRTLGRAPQFWRWEVGPDRESTQIEPQ